MKTEPNSVAIPLPQNVSRQSVAGQRQFRRLITPQSMIALATLTFSAVSLGHLHKSHLLSGSSLQTFIQDAGAIAPILFILLMALTVVVSSLPGLPLVCVAGAMWGGVWGGIYSVVGGFLGSLIAYGLGRSLGNSAIKAITGKTITFTTHRSHAVIGGLIFLTRLVPVFPFDVISYGAGLTRLPLMIYASTTLLGMAPPTFAIAFLGKSPSTALPASPLMWVMIAGLCVIMPLAIWQYNWLGLRSMMRID
ncbi:MAG: TVP38/TMEM64 family protein [Cyanobacteria bacterium P01_F01_bin.150]